MDQSKVIEILTTQAKDDAATNAVMHLFAIRKRARAEITLNSLTNKMKKEGFTFPKDKYISILKNLATLGVGRLETDPRGKVKALKDIRITLQSLGRAACGKAESVKGFKKRNKFRPVAVEQPRVVKALVRPAVEEVQVDMQPHITGLVINIGNKKVNFDIPSNLTDEEAFTLIRKLSK